MWLGDARAFLWLSVQRKMRESRESRSAHRISFPSTAAEPKEAYTAAIRRGRRMAYFSKVPSASQIDASELAGSRGTVG